MTSSPATPPVSPQSPASRLRQRLAVGLGLVISAIFLILAFQGLQPQAFLEALTSVDMPLLLVAASLYVVPVVLIGWRWQFLLNAVQRLSVGLLTRVVAIGYMGNNVYPLRAGEVLRVYLLRRMENVPITGSATTILIERLFDGVVMLSFVGVGVLWGGIDSEEIRLVASIGTPVFVLGLLALMLIAQFPQIAHALLGLQARLLPSRIATPVQHFGEQILAGLESLRRPSDFLGVLFTSYASRLVEALIYWLVLFAMGIDLNFGVALLVMGVVNLAGLLPTSPGQIGVFEFFASRILIAYGIADDTALAYAIVVHIAIWLPVTLAGFFFLAQQGLSWRRVRTTLEHQDDASA